MATPSSVAAGGGWNGNNGSDAHSHQLQHHINDSRSSNRMIVTTPSSTATTMTAMRKTTAPSAMAGPVTTTSHVMVPNANACPNTSNDNRRNPVMSVAHEADDFGVQVRTMGLKVHYTFDKEAKIQCLARCPQLLQIQTAAVDNQLTIGLVDLRTCIHIITEASPEITHRDCDYTIYAVDHSEPDLPLVGYGLLSWTIDSLLRGNPIGQPPKMVTGRVARNMLGIFGNGSRETLEIRLKLSEMAKSHRPVEPGLVEHAPSRSMPAPSPMEGTTTPAGQSEWSSFLQSNPHIGHSTGPAVNPNGREPVPHQASPAISQGPLSGPPPSIEPPEVATSPVEHREPPHELSKIAPTPVDLSALPTVPATSSRPSSRTSNRPLRRKPPTGRPRGRPRKKPTEGNTSGYEDGTEGEEPRDEGPAKKRVKTTMVGKADSNPFSSTHESLRVTASNSSSLRNFRPIATNAELSTAIQSQEAPRAPTPVPQGRFRGAPGQGANPSKARQESRLSQPPSLSYSTSYGESRPPLSPSMDGRSPESMAPTPIYSEGSPLEIGSSPPIPRMMPFLRSSPPPSSPVLPPMPVARLPPESAFASHEPDSLIEEEQVQSQVDDDAPPFPAPSSRSGATKKRQAPSQVYQVQNGPAGRDSVHICNYTTPHPSSSALAPPEVMTTQAPLVPDAAHPLPSCPSSKPKDTRSKSATHQPATPPRTDATDTEATPGAGVEAGPPDAVSAIGGQIVVEIENEHEMAPQTRYHTQARLELQASPQLQDAAQAEAAVPHPVPKTTQIISRPLDLSQDPVLQLALSFGMRDVSAPKSLPPRPSPPPPERPLPNDQQSEASMEPELPAVPPPEARVGRTSRDPRPKHSRQIHRSQSAGPLAFPMAAVPESEPSPLARTWVASPEAARPNSVPSVLRRATSSGPLALPAIEGVSAETALQPPSSMQGESCSPGEIILPRSSPQAPRSNKNIVKKHAIKQRLEQAIIKGEMPPFCTNCGAIETPTWRKIWVQEKQGEPENFELSEKPGRVTAVEVTQRDSDDKPVLHRIIKKSLAPLDDKKVWQEMLLCNPCGIWLSKSKSHRPPDRWEKDLSRLGQERRRRGTGRTNPRPKKPRFKDGVTRAHAVSEGYIPTDGIEPAELSSPARLPDTASNHPDLGVVEAPGGFQTLDRDGSSKSPVMDVDVTDPRFSRGNEVAQKTVDAELDQALGTTKRILFPTPRKDGSGSPKALTDVDVNTVQLGEHQQLRGSAKERPSHTSNVLEQATDGQDDLEELFGSPNRSRPSTPPPNASSAPVLSFKTPTRATPNHRPITRSLSRSLRSSRSRKSPGHQLPQRTPTKTPGVALAVPGSNSNARRRSPRLNQGGFEDAIFNTPVSRRIAQMLTDQSNFSIDGQEVDFDSLPALGNQDGEGIDFANLLSTEAALSSPAKQAATAIGFDYEGAANFWPNWNLDGALNSKD